MQPASSITPLADAVLAVDPEKVRPGWTAFIVIVLLGLAVVLLLRSFVKQTKRVNFTEDDDESNNGDDDA